MRPFLILLTTAAALCVGVSALPHQKRLAESEPWHLSGLSVYTSSDGSRNNSISFNLVDNNAGLQADTDCSRSVLGSAEDADNYYPCGNSSFNFRWDGTTLRIQRFYTDTAVGPCPLYCSITVYGNGTPSLALDYHSEAGSGTYQDSLDIFATEMVA